MAPVTSFVSLPEIEAARTRVRPAAVRTPLRRLDVQQLRALPFLELPEHLPELFLKDEAAQPIGSFKLRGAYNKIASLTPDELRRGVITYSSGNHAQGVAYAARALGARAVIVMPDNAPATKREATAALGAEIVTVGPASRERRERAEELVVEQGYVMVPPYDDAAIIAGQATCGVEIVEQLREAGVADALVLSPVSGGGLLSGISTGVSLRRAADGAEPMPVWGVEPELAADAQESFRRGELVEWPAAKTTRTLADGLRTQSLGELNFAHIRRYVGGIITVSEAEIRQALTALIACGVRAEPSGAVTLAGVLFHATELPQQEAVVCVLSGGNIDPALEAELRDEAHSAATARL